MIWNPARIIEDNFEKLVSDSNRGHVILWLGIAPLGLSILLELLSVNLSYNYVISFVSIMTGFLVNGVILTLSIDHEHGEVGTVLEERTYSNIFYGILVGITQVGLIFMFSNSSLNFILSNKVTVNIVEIGLNSVLIHFIVVIMIIIKGLYALYS